LALPFNDNEAPLATQHREAEKEAMTGEPKNRSEHMREPDEYEPGSVAMNATFERESRRLEVRPQVWKATAYHILCGTGRVVHYSKKL
jgi:hypothetical protein